MGARTPLIAGNWKMNLNSEESVNLVKALKEQPAEEPATRSVAIGLVSARPSPVGAQ